MKKILSIILCLFLLFSAIFSSLVLSAGAISTHVAPKDEWNLSANDYVAQIKAGWNYGNGLEDNNVAYYYSTDYYTNSNPSSWTNCKFDGYPTDCYGNTVYEPKEWERTMSYSAQWPLTKEMLTEVNKAGFDAIRIPCTWFNWTDYDSGSFTLGNGVTCTGDKITDAYLQRVKEIVDWACELDMYVIINMHHDEAIWLHVDTTNSENWNFTLTRYKNIWKQIAYYFRDYGSNVIFAGMNEIVWGEYDSNWYPDRMATTQENCDAHMGELYQSFVDVVRASGGNNTKRYLCIAPMGAQYVYTGNMRFPSDPKSDGGVNRIIIEMHEYNVFHDHNSGSTMSDYALAAMQYKQAGYGYIMGEGAFDDSFSNTDDLARSEVSREIYIIAKTYGIPIFQWDNGGIGGTKSSLNRYTNGSKGYVPPAAVWSMFNRSSNSFRFPNQVNSIMEVAYNYNSNKTSAQNQANYYYWKDKDYCKTSLNKGLFEGKSWKTGRHISDGSLDTSSADAQKSLYMDKISVTPGEKYELRLNAFYGVSNSYYYTVYGIKSDGNVVSLSNGTRTKGLYYQLFNKTQGNEGESVDISSKFNKDVAFTVPDGVTQLAISINGGKNSWVNSSHLISAIESTAITPSLSVYSGSGVTQSTTLLSSSMSTTTTETGDSGETNKYIKLNINSESTTLTRNSIRFDFSSTPVPSNAKSVFIKMKSTDTTTYKVKPTFRSTERAQAGGTDISKTYPSLTTDWETYTIDTNSIELNSIAIFIATNASADTSKYVYVDDIGYIDASGNSHVLIDFNNLSTASYEWSATQTRNEEGLIAIGCCYASADNSVWGYDLFGSIYIEADDSENLSSSSTTTATAPDGKNVTYDFDKKTPSYSAVGSIYTASVDLYDTDNALKIVSNTWDTGNYAQTDYVKVDIPQTGIKSITFDAVATGWGEYLPHYGVLIDGKVYWDQEWPNGTILKNTISTYTLNVGKKLKSFDGILGTFENLTDKVLSATDIASIDAIVFKTVQHCSGQILYVDNIIIETGSETEYSVTIDGVSMTTQNNIFTFPESYLQGFIAYTDGTNYYKEGDIVELTENKDFTAIAVGSVTMKYGASIRLNAHTGIRFYTVVDTDKIAELRNGGYTIELGTLIAPADYLTQSELNFDLGSGKYVDIKYKAQTYFHSGDFTGVVGSLINIRDNNISRDFVGRGYITVKDSEGNVIDTCYADYDDSNISRNTRSLKTVANALKNDESFDAQALYANHKDKVDAWANGKAYSV